MARIISASIDVTKIDKSKIQSVNKEGKPFKNGGKFLNIDITVNDEENDYGQDTSIKLSQSKEERESDTKPTYLGNGKTVWQNISHDPKAEKPKAEPQQEEDDLPF